MCGADDELSWLLLPSISTDPSVEQLQVELEYCIKRCASPGAHCKEMFQLYALPLSKEEELRPDWTNDSRWWVI
jgi:hypothetical protein